MIIDNHTHIFPFLGGNSEYKLEKTQMIYAQKLISDHFEDTRRIGDNAISKSIVWDKDKPGIEGMHDVNFHAGRFGRYEWTENGTDYYKQYMPVHLQDMISPPEFLIAQINRLGVDKAVLQRGHIYGKLENYYCDAIRKFPDRFIGLTQIDEAIAYEDEQIEELERNIKILKLKGLYFEPGALFKNGFRNNFDSGVFDIFWNHVETLHIPLYMQTDLSKFIDQMERLERILVRHPEICAVISLGLPLPVALEDGRIRIPDVISRLVTQHKVFLEIAYPISVGRLHDYPFAEAQKLISTLYDTFGPGRLVWGSDVPNVERYCTYAQSLRYIADYCKFLTTSDRTLIFSQNVLQIFGIE